MIIMARLVVAKTSGGFLATLVLGCVLNWLANPSICIVFGFSVDNQKISIVMPDIRPDHAEQYLCMAHRVTRDARGQFIVGFNPQGDAHRVHHMLLYGCQRPGIFQRDSPNFVWDCSEMHRASRLDRDSWMATPELGSSFETGPVCEPNGKQEILYGWALDAPALKLPDGVGFEIGGSESGIDFLVLQVHYGHYAMFAKMPALTDNSGLVLDIRPNIEQSGITRRAGVLLLLSMGYVLEGRSKHEIYCEIEDDIEIHPFRYRVHTHKMGTRVEGAKISNQLAADSTGVNGLGYGGLEETSELIGVKNPQEPQMFYPVANKNMTLAKGDKVYATCEFNNNKGHVVQIGQLGDDEMCNFYMMYWTNSTNLLTNSQCSTLNPPRSFLYSLIDKYSGRMF